MNTSPEFWQRPIAHHFRWLKRHDPPGPKPFVDRLSSSERYHVEGALGEALVWDYLDNHVDEIVPSDTPNARPDFLCRGPRGDFLVEVTTITTETIERHTRLNQHSSAGSFAPITRYVRAEVMNKAARFKNVEAKAPIVVIVVLLHPQSFFLIQRDQIAALLTSETHWTLPVALTAGAEVGKGFISTDLKYPCFTSPYSLDPTRRHISAVIAITFRRLSITDLRPRAFALGALSPDPIYPFEPSWLGDIDFCRLRLGCV